MCVEGEGRLEEFIDVTGPLQKEFLVAFSGSFIISKFSMGIHYVYKLKTKIETKKTILHPPKNQTKLVTTGSHHRPLASSRPGFVPEDGTVRSAQDSGAFACGANPIQGLQSGNDASSPGT